MALSASVVLCTYNGASYLDAQWASLLAQSRRPDEIVVRDDASTDNTQALLDRLMGDARARGIAVRRTDNAQNLGYIANFSAALQDASGEVLFLCDQDDVWHPDKLATQLEAFERRPGLLLLCSDARRVDASGRDLGRTLFDVLRLKDAELRQIHRGDGFQVLLRRSMATGATVALRRTLLDDAHPFPSGWVHDEWLAIVAAASGGFDCLDDALIDYRQHAANQIGMPERGWGAKWKDMRRPRADLLDGMIARGEALASRLQTLHGAPSQACTVRLGDELSHWRTRRDIVGAPWDRIGPISREILSGRYRRYGSGWRSALRDLIRRD